MADPAPITHASADGSAERNQLCRCSICGEISRCTPSNDFYVEGDVNDGLIREGKPLVCEGCFYKRLDERGIKTWPIAGRN